MLLTFYTVPWINTDKIKSVFDNPEHEFDHFFRMSSPIFLAVLAHLVKFWIWQQKLYGKNHISEKAKSYFGDLF